MSKINQNDGKEIEKGINGENAFLLNKNIYKVYYSNAKP